MSEGNASTTTSETRELNEVLSNLNRAEYLSINRGDSNGAAVVVIPKGREIRSLKPLLDEYLAKPERRRGTVTLHTQTSLIAIIKRFATPSTAIFAKPDAKAPTIVAVFDYYPVSGKTEDTDWLGHRASFSPPLSDEWTKWIAKNGTFMTQPDFAAFLEERIQNVIVPNFDDPKLKTYADLVQGTFAEPSQLVALSRNLEVNVDSKVKSAVRLASGEISLSYSEAHQDGEGQPIKVPNLFQVCIPVFYAGTFYRIGAHLRYRVGASGVAWAYQLVQPEVVFKDAFEGLAGEVEKGAEVPLYFGTPEEAAK